MKKDSVHSAGGQTKFTIYRALRVIRWALIGTCLLGAGNLTRVCAQTNTNNTPATLQISAIGTGNANLNWNNGGALQYAASLGGPWTTVSNGVSVLSSSVVPTSGSTLFFRVVNNGIASQPVSLVPNTLSAPLQVESASVQLLSSPVAQGNARLVVTVQPGSVSSSNVITLLINDSLTLLRDDGQFPDQTAGDGNFSAVVSLGTNDIAGWNAALASLPTNAQFSYTFRERSIVATNSLQPFSISNFAAGQAITILNNIPVVGFPFTPCSGSPVAYDPGKVEMITNLSVVADTNRTWDNNGPPVAGGVGGTGTKMGAWTFGRLMTDMANVGVPGNTVTSASDFVTRVFESWQNQQMINNDAVPAVPNLQALVLAPWIAASAAEGYQSNQLDLSIAPFRLLAIVNRVDLRGNSTYGSTTQNSCVPAELGGEARFVFGLIDPSQRAGSQYPDTASNQLTVILEYAVPISDCVAVRNWGAQWAALNNISFTQVAANPMPFTTDLAFNQALQKITDQFARSNSNPAQMPNKSAIAQVRFNDFLGTEWSLRQFNIDVSTGYLVEHTVNVTPAITYNNTTTLDAFIAAQNNLSFCNVGALLPTPSLPIPMMFDSASFLGGWAPEGVPVGTNGQTSGMFWQGTTCADPCTRHVLSLNSCNGCHTQETGTSFTQINPRSFGVASTLSGFLTGITIPDPSSCSASNYAYADLQRRVQDLNALVTCGCLFEVGHIQLISSH